MSCGLESVISDRVGSASSVGLSAPRRHRGWLSGGSAAAGWQWSGLVWLVTLSLCALPYLSFSNPLRLLSNVVSSPVVPVNEEEEKSSSTEEQLGERTRRPLRLPATKHRFCHYHELLTSYGEFDVRVNSRIALTPRWNNCLHCGLRLPMRC